MGARTNWFTPDLGAVDADPFSDEPAPIEDVGVPIRLDGDVAELDAELVRLMERINGLYQQGVTCEVMERADSTCHACPVAGSRGELCVNARELEKTLTRLAVIRVGERR